MTTATLVGSEVPRLRTEPLRELTPETSKGFEAIRFAERVCGLTLLPWQKWWLIHALEMREDGSFRFRTVLTLVARQNGKSYLLKVLALYFMYVRQVRLIIGAAQELKVARESWMDSYNLAASIPALARQFAAPSRRGLPPGRRDTTGDETMVLQAPPGHSEEDARRYIVSATSRGAGRGRRVDLLIMDEIRELRDMLAWAALSKTTLARPNSIKALISNAGDEESVLLNHLRGRALSGEADDIAIFEWSAPDGAAIDDRDGWRQANPALGHTALSEAGLEEAMNTDPPEVFRTECLCQNVANMDTLISETAWEACGDAMLTLDALKGRLVAVLDIAPDGAHATLMVGGRQASGPVALEVKAAWTNTRDLVKDLPGHLKDIKPTVFGWFPGGPAAELGMFLRKQPRSREIKGAEVTESCMGLVGTIYRGGVVHGFDPLLNAHVLGAKRLDVADGYRFVRKGAGHVDAAYAAAGVVLLTPASLPKAKKRGLVTV